MAATERAQAARRQDVGKGLAEYVLILAANAAVLIAAVQFLNSNVARR